MFDKVRKLKERAGLIDIYDETKVVSSEALS